MVELAGLLGLEGFIRTASISSTPRVKQKIGIVGAYILRVTSKNKLMGAGFRCFRVQSVFVLQMMSENRSLGMGKVEFQRFSSQLLDRMAVAGHCDLSDSVGDETQVCQEKLT